MKNKHNHPDSLDRIAEAFIAIASEQGVNRVTLEGVSKKAGVPFSTAHYQLRALNMTVVQFGLSVVGRGAQQFIQTYLDKEGAEMPEEDPLRQYVEGSFAWLSKFRSHANIWLFQYHVIAVDPAIRVTHQAFLDAAAMRIEKLIFESVGKGFYHEWSRSFPREKTARAAVAIHSLLMGAMTRALVSVDEEANEGGALNFHLDVTLHAITAILRHSPDVQLKKRKADR